MRESKQVICTDYRMKWDKKEIAAERMVQNSTAHQINIKMLQINERNRVRVRYKHPGVKKEYCARIVNKLELFSI